MEAARANPAVPGCRTCPGCAVDNGTHRNFCHDCGTAVVRFCGRCRFANELADRYCGGCGCPMPRKKAAPRPSAAKAVSATPAKRLPPPAPRPAAAPAAPATPGKNALASQLVSMNRGTTGKTTARNDKPEDLGQDDIDALFEL